MQSIDIRKIYLDNTKNKIYTLTSLNIKFMVFFLLSSKLCQYQRDISLWEVPQGVKKKSKASIADELFI